MNRPETMPAALEDRLERLGLAVVTDPAVLAGHAVDWTGRWRGPVIGMVRPRTTSEVAAALRVARGYGMPVQVQGGNTGLVGGSVPEVPSLLLATTGLSEIGPVDRLERTVVVGSGVTAARLTAHTAAAGLRFGVDLAARDSATIGGMAATNAGGMGVCAYGMMRDNVRGLTAVLADGRVIRTSGRPRKDNCGYDLAGLLIGSEGTLGVITEVEVALHPAPPASTVGLLAVPDLATAVAAARAVQSGEALLLAAEVVDRAGVRRAAGALQLADPLPAGAPWLLLLEVADGGGAEGLAEVAELVVAVGRTSAERSRLWEFRERQTELYSGLPGAVDKLDVSVRLDRLDRAVELIRAALAGHDRPPGGGGEGPGAAPWVGFFGHALDGNLHVQLVGTDVPAVQRVLSAVVDLGGSISAEHGIGRLKAPYLPMARSSDEIALMRKLKDAMDPDGVLNAGVLLDRAQ